MNSVRRWPKGFYIVGGIVGMALVGIAFALNVGTVSPVRLLGVFLCVTVILSWMYDGLRWHQEQERLAQEKAQAAARAEQLRQEAQKAAQRAAVQVNARRKVSHAGTTIKLHRTSASQTSVDPAVPTNPAAPADPSAPAKPAESVDPSAPAKPAESVDPSASAKPAAPSDSAAPAKPATSADPSASARPTMPLEPPHNK